MTSNSQCSSCDWSYTRDRDARFCNNCKTYQKVKWITKEAFWLNDI